MAKKTKKETWKPLFEVESGDFMAQGTWVSDDADSTTYGAINLIVADLVAVKCFVIQGSKAPFISFPSHKSGKEYYNDVVPMSKEVAKELAELAQQCADAFEDL